MLYKQNTIALVANRNTMNFYINELKIDFSPVEDGSYTSGNISLIAYRTTSPDSTEVAYSNAKLWTL